MKNHTSTKTIALLGLLASAAVASATIPPVNVSAGTIGGVTNNLGGSFGAGGAAGPALGSGFGAASHAAGSVGGGFDVAGAPNARIEAFESIGMRRERLAREAAAKLDTTLDSGVAPVPNEQAASAALSTGFSAETIRAASAEERQQIAAAVNQRIATSSDAVAALKADAKALDATAQAEFKAARKDVGRQAKELKAAAKAARKGSAERWEELRAELAQRYDAYAASVARAEAVVSESRPAMGGRVSMTGEAQSGATRSASDNR